MPRQNLDKTILDVNTFSACRPLIAQIAHDFNNLLTPLLAYPALIKHHLSEPSYGEMLDSIEKAAHDMIHINEQLMLLSSNSSTGKTEVPADEIISSAIIRLKEYPEYATAGVNVQIAENLPTVNVSVDLMAHAVLNLLLNAIESTSTLSDISVVAILEDVDSDHPCITESPSAGQFVRITVKDNGPGFSEDMLGKATVPFVTTKKEQGRRGAGLGLSTAFTICRDHGGFLSLQNSAEGGAEASIFLPPAPVDHASTVSQELDASNETSNNSVESPEPCTKNRVLLVDDEATIVKLFQMIITASISDCIVDTAPNGQEALKEFEKHHHSVIVMDLHMPIMDGQTAFNEMHKIAEQRNWAPPAVVFCTGFAPPDIVHRIVSTSSRHCLLSKPVRGEILVDAIKNRLT